MANIKIYTDILDNMINVSKSSDVDMNIFVMSNDLYDLMGVKNYKGIDIVRGLYLSDHTLDVNLCNMKKLKHWYDL